MTMTRRSLVRLSLAVAPLVLLARPVLAAEQQLVVDKARIVVESFLNDTEFARMRVYVQNAYGVLIVPDLLKGGFIVGGQYGEGALLRSGRTAGYYSIAGPSLGFLAGAQAAGLAMFFMTEDALAALMASDGWEIGTGPSVVVLDRGVQANLTTTTAAEPVYAITFNQEGLMAALALNGTKITRINPSA